MDPISSYPNLPSTVVPVSKGTRFANALLDGFAIGIVAYFVGFFLGTVMSTAAAGPLGNIIGIGVQFCYYYFQEKGTGITLGKRMTSTKAVMADGSPLTDDAVLKRSLWRLIPLVDAASFLFAEVGWHDKYSNTRVVSTK